MLEHREIPSHFKEQIIGIMKSEHLSGSANERELKYKYSHFSVFKVKPFLPTES